MTPAERSAAARRAALTRWAMTPDRSAATAKARRASLARFEDQVDPDGLLTAEQRAQGAARLRRAHMIGMALESSRRRSA